jgi:hypothetical protein
MSDLHGINVASAVLAARHTDRVSESMPAKGE